MKVGKERIKEEIIKNKNFFMKILYKIKKSDKTSSDKTDLIVTAYEDYLFYNNRAAFEEYWRKRSSYNGPWDPYSDNLFVKEAENNFFKSVNNLFFGKPE